MEDEFGTVDNEREGAPNSNSNQGVTATAAAAASTASSPLDSYYHQQQQRASTGRDATPSAVHQVVNFLLLILFSVAFVVDYVVLKSVAV